MDNYEKLEKIALLKDKKILNNEEFENHKNAILMATLVETNSCSEHRKNGVIFVLLAWFFGLLGFHNFYAGYNGKGVGQLVLTLFSWSLFFVPLVASAVWAFVEMLVINKDARGCEFGGDKRTITILRIISVVFVATMFISIFGYISYMYVPMPIAIIQAPAA